MWTKEEKDRYAREYYLRNKPAIAAQRKDYYANNTEAIAANGKAYRANNSEEVAYLAHKTSAKKRGIPFNLTFEEYQEIWNPYRADQTANPYKWAMCRHLDQGGYELENVSIQLMAKNSRDAAIWRAEAKAYEMDSAADDIGVGNLHVESSCEDLYDG